MPPEGAWIGPLRPASLVAARLGWWLDAVFAAVFVRMAVIVAVRVTVAVIMIVAMGMTRRVIMTMRVAMRMAV